MTDSDNMSHFGPMPRIVFITLTTSVNRGLNRRLEIVYCSKPQLVLIRFTVEVSDLARYHTAKFIPVYEKNGYFFNKDSN